MTKKGTNFDHAMLRMLNSGIDADGLHQVFKNLEEAIEISETESAALTLGFSDDEVLVAGDYVPTITLALVKVSEHHAEESAKHLVARKQAEEEALKEYKEQALEEMKMEDRPEVSKNTSQLSE